MMEELQKQIEVLTKRLELAEKQIEALSKNMQYYPHPMQLNQMVQGLSGGSIFDALFG
jgi:hypothetical protein